MATTGPSRIASSLAGILALIGFVPSAPRAADAPPAGWKDTAEFSYVITAGNSETSTLGFKDKLWRKWDRSAFELNAGGVRAESTSKNLFAVGPSTTSFDVVDGESATTAENYFLNGRYDRKISEHFFWFVGAGWDRNRFAGIQNRTVGIAGVGNTWIDTDTTKFRTDYSVTYTDEKDVVEDPSFKTTFTGGRVSWNFLRKIGATSSYTNDLVLDDNFDDSKDYRANMINSLTASLSSRLALKVSLQWLYDHQPALKTLDLFDAAPPAGANIGSVLVSLDTLDTVFTTSLVVNF